MFPIYARNTEAPIWCG